MNSMSSCPFPYFGGKSQVADLVWSKLGNVKLYQEPFCGSCAILLGRPKNHFEENPCLEERICDNDHLVANFWRSIKKDPDKVAFYADRAVVQIELHSVHEWLVNSERSKNLGQKLFDDVDFFDAEIAGTWAWGQASWIGNWCVEGKQGKQVPRICPCGLNKHTRNPEEVRAYFNLIDGGINGNEPIGETYRSKFIRKWLRCLSARLREVQVVYGTWRRLVSSHSTMERPGIVGVFLDPPYPVKQKTVRISRYPYLYKGDSQQDLNELQAEIFDWCKQWGKHPGVRIAVCGYDGDGYEDLIDLGWKMETWIARGGYNNQKNKDQRKRERIWFSPNCLEVGMSEVDQKE